MLKKISPLFFLLFTTISFSQKHSGEVGILVDNDLFTSTVNDQYYTNGIEIFYRFLNQNENSKIKKEITEIKFGQYIYNPHTVEAKTISKQDRPFAGYLFGEFGINKYYQSESVLKTNLQIGVVGPSSQAEGFQKSFHKFFGYKDVEGWDYQIRDAFSVQGNLLYSTKLFRKKTSEIIDFHLQGEANFGTILNGISVGPLARISLRKKLLPIYDSNLYGASLNSDKTKYKEQREFYFYINPSFNYQIFDATIQGSMFNNSSPVTYDLMPMRFNGEAGFKYRKENWNCHYSFVYRGKEIDNARNEGYFYGSIGVSYLLN